MKKSLLSIITISAFNIALNAQNVYIPDPNFKAYLVSETSINTNSDFEIQVSEANTFTGTINCGNQNISDLTGIEMFTSLTKLLCQSNSLSTIDISQNTALTEINLLNNNLNSLDVTQNTALTKLTCGGNPLGTIDLSQNTSLTILQANNNNLSSLDVSQNTALTNLICPNNNLTSLNVSQNTNLFLLSCGYNNLTSLDISQNTSLGIMVCNDNNLTSLNMTNISTNTLTNFGATSNPNLTCIDVDDIAAATVAWTSIDAGTSFSLNCVIDLVTSIDVQGQSGATTISTPGGTLQMEATVMPTYADDDTYTWSVINGTGSASIDASGLLTAISNGTVTVTATANDASGVTGSLIITISNQSSASINENGITELVEVYPNPVQSQLFINSSEVIESIVIVDALGSKVKMINTVDNSIDVSDLKQGVYFIQLETGKGLVSKKFIKE